MLVKALPHFLLGLLVTAVVGWMAFRPPGAAALRQSRLAAQIVPDSRTALRDWMGGQGYFALGADFHERERPNSCGLGRHGLTICEIYFAPSRWCPLERPCSLYLDYRDDRLIGVAAEVSAETYLEMRSAAEARFGEAREDPVFVAASRRSAWHWQVGEGTIEMQSFTGHEHPLDDKFSIIVKLEPYR